MSNQDRLLTLKEAVIYSNHAEENIRLQIERGALQKYNKHGIPLKNPLREKGFFKLSELMAVYDIHEDPEVVKKRFLARKQNSDSVRNVCPQRTIVLRSSEINLLDQIESKSIDTWILAPSFKMNERWKPTNYENIVNSSYMKEIRSYLEESNRILKLKSNLLIHSIPRYLPYYGIEVEKYDFFFKYWIIYPFNGFSKEKSLNRFIPEANGILYYVKSRKNFLINRVREPYRNCNFCSKPLKDYGGKKHLCHKDGMVTSDIWHLEKGFDFAESPSDIPYLILRRLIDLSCNSHSTLLLAPFDGEVPNELRE
ncbi:MAG: DNA methyltransferase [Candidatus Hodarchaeota archaeon]